MKSFFLALQFISRIHIFNVSFDEVAFGRATRYFPLVGLILGGLTAGIYWLVSFVFPSEVSAAMTLLAMVVLTGGIHLDGFMDSMDGLFCGREQERKLEIMRDSRVGAFGVIGLAALFLLKFTAILGLSPTFFFPIIVITPVISRWAMVISIKFFPYVRKQGLGSLYSQYTGWSEFILATVFAAGISIILAGLPGICILIFTGLVTCLMCRSISRQLGGLTGDIYGSVNEIMEVFVLLLSYPIFKYIPTNL
ncbi:adenosylcobinamide-GDP ribazoletransferase [Desulfolucanica intricata]|uniref:adenosylcobinamide-GDP ribazoletransferase n=1 Tax=Desulfolucanica intricata TaxID=1285191 RepID=UPI00082D82A0|nr:adenosylcobinamide-GDP ribazoletransferase [Desulfolucanica intricata]